jgi:hypothetical protein
MAGELTALRAVVSSTMESVLGAHPTKPFQKDVVGELAAEF